MTTTFLSTLENTPHAFLQPSLPLHTDALAYLRAVLDPLAQDVSAAQQDRQREARRKRKRGDGDDDDAEEDPLRIKQIHVEGFAFEQVWAQAKRVIDAARGEAERGVEALEVDGEMSGEDEGRGGKRVAFADEEESEDEEDEDEEDFGVEGVDYEVEGVDDGEEIYDEEEDEDEDEDLDDFRDDYDDENDGQDLDDTGAAELVKDKFGLNDGFFSIDDFNKQSEFLEQQDARGENDGAASDEEEVDWDANPLHSTAVADDASMDNEGSDEDDDEDEDGPTFGDPDALSEDDEEELEAGDIDGVEGLVSTKPLMYADFFAPPASKKKKGKKGRPNPHNFPEKSTDDKEDEEDEKEMDRTMAAVHRDLFEDDESDHGSADEDPAADADLPKLDPSDPRSRRSTHERRRAALAEEIRKLEAANVAKRQWTLSGEARAADRPLNSLLEEDLDFERTGKPVPVITAEISESLEALIKRRILAHDFQDIPRRRPDDLAAPPRRGRLSGAPLDDSKPTRGLADEYADMMLAQADPSAASTAEPVSADEQAAILALWRDVAGKLDALSSWRFRPRAPAPAVEVRADAPAITVEDARPAAGADAGAAAASRLAPQEVYRAGEAAAGEKGEVVAMGKGGLVAAREELTREEKKRRRRREKEKARKAGGEGSNGANGTKKEGKAAREKKEVLGELKRGGVKVIGKKGAVEDVEGRAVRQNGSGQGAAMYKL